MGISFSGNILTFYLGDNNAKSHLILDGAAAICSPHRVHLACNHLNTSLFGAVQKYMAKKIKTALQDNVELLKDSVKQ